jgi:hypothetical protein
MHGRMYVCVPTSRAKSKAGVVRRVNRFLDGNGFTRPGYWSCVAWPS